MVSQQLCWRCLRKGHIARRCTNKEIKVCDKYLHCEIACPCNYRGKKFISGSASVNRSLNSFCRDRKGVRFPILPIKVYTARGQKRVHGLIDTDSVETLTSKKLYAELNLEGFPLEELLITADGNRSMISSF